MDKERLAVLRQEVNEMYFKKEMSKREVIKQARVSNDFVTAWTKSPDQDFAMDNRGWPKGKRRKLAKVDEQRIKEIYHSLEDDPYQFYSGATVIEQKWRNRYSSTPPPSLPTIGRMLSDLGLSQGRKKGKNKGASRYLCYPEYTIYYLLGGRVLESDFIGKKYLTGRTEPVNFVGFSFKKEPKLRYFRRVDGQTATNFIEKCQSFFDRFEKPDFVKVDNCSATIGSVSGKRNVSKAMQFLLKNQVIPIFAVPRRPFSQASIEGNNSVFSRKFWNRIQFKSLQEVDQKLEWFNLSSQRYTGYRPPKQEKSNEKDFIPKTYFIRQVKQDTEQTDKAFIDVLNEKVSLPSSYTNYFVLAEWNLKEEQLYIHFEKEQKPKIVENLSFKINQRSKEKCTDFI